MPTSRVRVAEHAGFCFGVQRAIEMAMAEAEAEGRLGSRIYALGPLIHNRQVVDRFEAVGVRVIDEVSEAAGGVLLIRAHGVPKAILDEAANLGIRVIDTTCPFVKRVHERAQSLLAEGYDIVVVGEHDHPEVVGIMGWIEGRGHIVEHPEDVAKLPRMSKVGLVVQTTQTLENLAACVRELLERTRELRVYNTLCDATMQRQRAAEELAQEVSLMVVVGGKHSGNTRRLVDICAATGTPTYHIEEASELRAEWFNHLGPEDLVGLTAGASTPDWSIREVEEALSALLSLSEQNP